MSQRRRSSQTPSSAFNVRWHTVANPATSSLDIMSSPDPLNDSIEAVMPPSSQRIMRSQRTDKLAPRSASPRKQQFELEVGNNRSPQRLLVTVETEESQVKSSTKRKLFQSPTPSKRTRRTEIATTTTVVPLRESIEEETAATPRRRGRPRKTNGTPMPSTGKRKATSPTKPTPKRPVTANKPDPLSDPVSQPTPTPKRRGRPPKNRALEPSSELKPPTSSARGGRKRRQAFLPSELEDIADEAVEPLLAPPPLVDESTEDEAELVGAPPNDEREEFLIDVPPIIDDDAESDIWMATLSHEATPQAEQEKSISPSSVTNRPAERALPASIASILEEEMAGSSYTSDISSVGGGRPRNNDTIAQGEDFSMIFMDSVPSLAADFKSSMAAPRADEEVGEETNIIINNTLESFRQSWREEIDNEEEVEEEIMGELAKESDAPVEQTRESAHDGQDIEEEDEVDLVGDLIEEQPVEPQPHEEAPADTHESPIPAASEILESAPAQGPTPIRSTLGMFSPSRLRSPRWSRTPRQSNASPLRRQVLKTTARAAMPAQSGNDGNAQHVTVASSPKRGGPSRFEEEDSNVYEDSFSEIPQNVLEAATPKRPGAIIEVSDDNDSEESLEAEQVEELIEGQSQLLELEVEEEEPAQQALSPQERPLPSNVSSAARSDGRLPTPDDTPPNYENDGDNDKAGHSNMSSSPIEPHAQLESEHDAATVSVPQILEPPQESRQSQDRGFSTNDITPINQLSSPVMELQSLQPDAHEKTKRPFLSPIVRAGRALQSVTSDPPSPEPRERQLGSPFRSSVSKDSRSGSREVQNDYRMSSSPARPYGSVHPQSFAVSHRDDPFGSFNKSINQASFMHSLGRNLTGSMQKARQSPSASSSMRVTPPDDEMSWVANEGPISPRLRGDNTLEEAAGPAVLSASKLPQSRAHDEAEVQEERHVGDDSEGSVSADDETDIWEVEAKRSSPEPSHHQSFVDKASAPVPRRAAIPSPWTKRTQLRQSIARRTETAQAERHGDLSADVPAAEEIDEFSLLAQRQQEEGARKEAESARKPKGFDLSAFFSSPAAIPGLLASKLMSSYPLGPRGATTEEEPPQPSPKRNIQTSTMFPRSHVPQMQFERQSSPRRSLFSSPSRQDQQPQVPVAEASPDPREQVEMPTIAQKTNFTPRPRQTTQAFLQALDINSAAPTPPRMQLSHADIQKWQRETTNAGEDSPELLRPQLRALPPKNASPTKSSLRSPMKPHTPGRVVEFTSSVLSPVEQAKLRQQRRMSNSVVSHDESATLQPKPRAVVSAVPPPQTDDKENQQDNDVSMNDAHAQDVGKTRASSSLSQTVWSRRHWVFLEHIMHERRKGPFDRRFERRAEKYLGKTVSSQGEAIKLERWHLDCVDAFQAKVGGWDEAGLVKRLFGLLVSEDMKRRGVRREAPGVMFH